MNVVEDKTDKAVVKHLQERDHQLESDIEGRVAVKHILENQTGRV